MFEAMAAAEWRAALCAGWREFVTLTALFDCDAGFLVNDTVVFSADVLVLRESSEARSVRQDRKGVIQRCLHACELLPSTHGVSVVSSCRRLP